MTRYCMIFTVHCSLLYWGLLYCNWGVLYLIRLYPLYRTLLRVIVLITELISAPGPHSIWTCQNTDTSCWLLKWNHNHACHHVILDNDNPQWLADLFREPWRPPPLAQIKQISDVLQLITHPPQSHWVLMARHVFGLASPKSLNRKTSRYNSV